MKGLAIKTATEAGEILTVAHKKYKLNLSQIIIVKALVTPYTVWGWTTPLRAVPISDRIRSKPPRRTIHSRKSCLSDKENNSKMSFSRRKFLKAGAVVSAALVLKPSTLVFGNNAITSDSATTKKTTAQLYTREMFEPYVGDIFRVRVGKQVVDLKLAALANEQTTSGKTTRTDSFSLRFHATRPLPAARVHKLNHSKLGSFDLFMVQSKDGARFLQTAIVNHLV